MLIRKPLYGNLRPNPGDLYDPRDGSCLPNFHLSTTHNPNLALITQDLVRYDIQLVREVGNLMPPLNHPTGGGVETDAVRHPSLTLLAVAEYSEGLSTTGKNNFPFVVHKVYYREAIAGVLLLRHAVADRDVLLMQNVFRKCIPDPENFSSQLFEQSVRSIKKVSIIQHGQEYHYTNIKMAFTEMCKIVNFVCSPTNLNARSVLVEIPAVVNFQLLDENKYLAYLYEQQRLKKQKEEEQRQREKRELLMIAKRYGKSYLDRMHNNQQVSTQNNYNMRPNSEPSSHEIFGYNASREALRVEFGHPSSDDRRYFLQYPIDTKIQTKNGKKTVTYCRTGQQIIWGGGNSAVGAGGYGILLEDYKQDARKKKASSSTPNLTDEALFSETHSQQHTKQYPLESYLRRSHSVENLNDRDKITRYPAPLIEPGRQSFRERKTTKVNADKWKKLAPLYRPEDNNFDSSHNGNQKSKDAVKSDHHVNPRRGTTIQHQTPTGLTKSASLQPPGKNPTPPSTTHMARDDDNISVVSAFSDISINPQQQREADEAFNAYFDAQELNKPLAQSTSLRPNRSSNTSSNNKVKPIVQNQNGSINRKPVQNYSPHDYLSKNGNDQNQRQQLRDAENVTTQEKSRVSHANSYPNQVNTRPAAQQYPRPYTKPVNLHPMHLQAAEQFLNKYSSYFPDSYASSLTDTPPTSLGSLPKDSDLSLTLDPSPSSTPTPSGSDTLDRDFVYKAYPVKVRDVQN
ncbi:uncharacterized protein LOC108679547 [Hyalella azteca]|uniref:Uncharacterized protein LOC108679547 n=1 Tax=Hyalella azteca TaxID=294128 RepID=A0A8B7PC62_HYAAZ|nr:uncharacterized protein LOC108679547 [Hyalella azteca]